jgi:dTDP-4-amino-4,6-dideoxygalactose transaminase
MAEHDKYKVLISKVLATNPSNIFLYWKGRVALYALLKAMGISNKDEVVIPGFTCVVVPNAIKYLEARPVYIDIEPRTLNPSLESYKSAVTSKTKVIIVQNTFGLATDVDEISHWAQEKNIFTIEDCAHGFGGTYNDKPNGTFCDAAYFSTQWNKPFSTGLGGFSVINYQELLPEVVRVNKELEQPGFVEKKVLACLLIARDKLLTSLTYWKFLRLYRFLSRNKLTIGSNSSEELSGTVIPRGYFKAISDVQVRKGIRAITTVSEITKLRKRSASLYSDFLKDAGKYYVHEDLHKNHSFLKYPILVKDRELFTSRAMKSRIELGDWFCSPIHPVRDNLERWNLDSKQLPVARELSKCILNLPTDLASPNNVLEFLKANSELIQ